MTVEKIKELGKNRSDENLKLLLQMYNENYDLDIKREIVSSIGRQKDKQAIYNFIAENAFKKTYMELIYQMYRTTLYRSDDSDFTALRERIEMHYDNELLQKMKRYRQNKYKNAKQKKAVQTTTILEGDCVETLKEIESESVQLVFTSPPYYNARIYSDYVSYAEYLEKMKKALLACNRVLEPGRFIIYNVSPVITKRPGREFESIRYPIHFDFHKIMQESGFYFVDEIIWIKPETSVKNRIGGYQQSLKPLSYKPNCITESILVYRKNADFLLDQNIKKYPRDSKNDPGAKIDTTNCWYIHPKSSKNHPAIFPEELCEKVLNYYSYPGDVVLDPFAGSGTFGKVAKRLNRTPILCEINKEYIDLMKRSLTDDI